MAPAELARLEQPEAFIRRVSSNLAKDWARSRSIAERSSASIEVASNPIVDSVALLESRDMLHRLEGAISRLKPRTREIFLAHRLRGLTYAEIATATGLSVKGVEKQMSRAIAQLMRLVDDC